MKKEKRQDKTTPGSKKTSVDPVATHEQEQDQRPLIEALRESEERWQFALEGSGDGVWDWNVQTNEVYFSKQWKEMLGFCEDEIGNSLDEWATRVHPDDIEWVTEEVKRHLRAEISAYVTEHRVRCKDGTYKWILDRGKVMSWAEDGEPLRMVGTHRDITARKRAEETLKESEVRARAMLQAIPDLMFRMDNKRVFLDYKADIKDLHAQSEPTPIGKSNRDITPPEFADLIDRQISKTLESGALQAFEYQLSIPGRGLRDYEARMIVSGTDEVTAIVRDITDRKRAEEVLQKAHDELEHRVRERTAELQSAYDTLAENEMLYRNLFDNASIGMFQVHPDGSGFLSLNKAFAKMLGYESPEEMMSAVTDISTQIHADPENRRKILAAFEHNDWYYAEQPYFRKDGSIMIGKLAERKVLNHDGAPAYLEGIVEDITERKKMEEDLGIRTRTLEEVNTALRVFVRQIGEDKKELEARFVSNVKGLVLPYVEKVKKGRLDPEQQSCLNIIAMNLNEIVSPFLQSIGQLGLTPRETQIATLIKDGKTTKEIAGIIGVASSAVDTYRNKIRHKLSLNNKKINLQSYLQSIK